MADMEGRPPASAPEAGWYANPAGDGLRWWDGRRWTDHVHPGVAAPGEPAAGGRDRPRGTLVGRWPLLLGGVAIVAVAIVAFVLLSGGSGSDSGGSASEQAVSETVAGFLAAVAAGDQSECERFIDAHAEAMKRYLRLSEGVPGAESTCGFIGTAGRVEALSVDEVTVHGDEARVTFDGNPTVMHLSQSGGRWVIDGIS